jgi:hypothetical protein
MGILKQAKASGLAGLADGNLGRRMAKDNYIHQRTYHGV